MKKGMLVLYGIMVFLPLQGFCCAGPDVGFYCPFTPDPPVINYISGKLGIVRPELSTQYLILAYRYFKGFPLNQAEQAKFLQYIDHRKHNPYWAIPYELRLSESWRAAREQFGGIDKYSQDFSGFRQSKNYWAYLNCPEDAFKNAAQILNERIKQYLIHSAKVQDWLKAQDTVFLNCSPGRSSTETNDAGPFIPKETPFQDPILRKDRAYQIAAAYFYGEDYKEARERFRNIAADAASQYRNIANYLVVRTYLREASLKATNENEKLELLRKAEESAKYILANPVYKSIHPQTAQLLQTINARIYPEREITRLAGELLKNWTDGDWVRNMDDYIYLFQQNKSMSYSNDLTEWLSCYSRPNGTSLQRSLDKYDQGHHNRWLIPILSNIDPGHPRYTEILKAAEAIPLSSNAFPTIAFYRVILYTREGKRETAIDLINKLLALDDSVMPQGSKNLIIEEKLKLASGLQEYLSWDYRPLFVDSPSGWQQEGTRNISITSRLFLENFTSPETLAQLCISEKLPPRLNRAIALMGWVRSIATNDDEMGRRFADVFIGKRIKSILRKDFERYATGKTEEERRFQAATMILENLRLSPWHFEIAETENYTLLQRYEEAYWEGIESSTNPYYHRNIPEHVKDKRDMDLANAELEKLKESGPPLIWLTESVLKHAEEYPQDPRVPRALYFISHARKWRNGEPDLPIVQKAKALLEGKYPKEQKSLEAADLPTGDKGWFYQGEHENRKTHD